MSQSPPTRENHHNEETRGGEPLNPGSQYRVSQDQPKLPKQFGEATESIHDVSPLTSRDDAASSLEDNELPDIEASIAEPPYTVFTASQKRFIVLLAACAGFFSAVSSLRRT